MLNKGDHIQEIPIELEKLLANDQIALDFFESLSKSYKQVYRDWIGAAKQEATRISRAEKTLLMLRNK